jgi:hypothetical protein
LGAIVSLNMFGQSRAAPERSAKVRSIKEWAREALHLPEDVVIMATELRCTEEGCPPLETVIAVMREDGAQQQFKIHKALLHVLYEDVEEGAARMLRGEEHNHRSPTDHPSEDPPKVARPGRPAGQ